MPFQWFVAIRYLRSGPGLKWAIPVALVLTPAYLLTASACTTALDRGGPGWLHLFVVALIWNAMKVGMLGFLTPLLYVERVIKSRAVSAS